MTFEADAVQLKAVPATPFGLLMAMLVVFPEHKVWLEADTVGVGFTVTVTGTTLPLQPLAVGVMEYVTVPWIPLVDNIWFIGEPEPELAPVTFDVLAVQLKTVPEILLGLVIAMLGAAPEHIVAGDAAASGTGFIIPLRVLLEVSH